MVAIIVIIESIDKASTWIYNAGVARTADTGHTEHTQNSGGR